MEDSEKPSFENFLSKPTTLTDHLIWQLGSLHVKEDVYRAAELVIGNLNEDGYLIATEDELLGLMEYGQGACGVAGRRRNRSATGEPMRVSTEPHPRQRIPSAPQPTVLRRRKKCRSAMPGSLAQASAAITPRPSLVPPRTEPSRVPFSRDALREAIDLVQQMDPIGVGARDLRECLLAQLHHLKTIERKNGNGNHLAEKEAIDDAIVMVDQHLHELAEQDITRKWPKPWDARSRLSCSAMDFIRTLDPRPGLRYNKIETRLIEPDVAFVKQGDEYLVVMNDEEIPQLRLNPAYRRLLQSRGRRKGRAQLRQRALQVGHPAHQEHRAAQADHPARVLFASSPASAISSTRASTS